MAKTGSVWGIDLGQCALKALRCREGDEPGTIVAEAFDYIEYPKMLGQPDANAAELLAEALETFLSRNSLTGDRVAISVSGQSGLSRFIKLPPVETKKIPDIVKYEARQQIPFALEDVVWDYQQMAGGSVEEGFALETEVGLFAMKRDQVYRALKPFLDAGIEVDIIQLTPVALYNFAAFDQMPDIPPPEQYTADDPPESTIVMSLGADMSDLVVSNGYRVWQRTVNLGGNHFTKALTKQMKLTFAKAEHLKRNAMKAEDPKAVFQAMRPVFGELLGEVQRSLSFFQNIDRTAKLGRVVALGNAMKLRGLHKYLAQNLGLEVAELDRYANLSGSAVTESPAFKDNMLSFGVCYGLCVQGLGLARLSTNLVPPEIVKDRMIKAKKPWAVAAVALLLLGCTIGYFGKWREWSSARPDENFKDAFSKADQATAAAKSAKDDYDTADAQFKRWESDGEQLAGINQRRLLWAEMLKAVNDCLPRDPAEKREELEKLKQSDYEKYQSTRDCIYVDAIDCQFFPDLGAWVAEATKRENELKVAATGGAPTAPAGGTPDGAAESAAPATPPTGQPADPAQAPASGEPGQGGAPTNGGWVIQITGHHFHNDDKRNFGPTYVQNTLVRSLNEKPDVELIDDQAKKTKVSTKDLGMEHALIVSQERKVQDPATYPNPNMQQVATAPQPGAAAPAAANRQPASITLRRFDFKVQFAWKPKTLSQRKAEEEKKKATPEEPKVADTAAPKAAE
jgi:type IV pilus assembly protein PilM